MGRSLPHPLPCPRSPPARDRFIFIPPFPELTTRYIQASVRERCGLSSSNASRLRNAKMHAPAAWPAVFGRTNTGGGGDGGGVIDGVIVAVWSNTKGGRACARARGKERGRGEGKIGFLSKQKGQPAQGVDIEPERFATDARLKHGTGRQRGRQR